MVAYCFWALLPGLRAKISARIAGGFVWGAIFILCVAILPLRKIREQAMNRAIAAQEKYDADLASVPAGSPLWAWTPFLESRNNVRQEDLLGTIREFDRRQTDAEIMLERGDFPLSYLGRMDLTPTPALRDKARALLRKRVEPLVQKNPESRSYADIAVPVSQAADAMEWLSGYDCAVDAESVAWENMTKGYKGSDWDIHHLVEARDPKNLGRIVRNYPVRFSMLTPKAHLKAWLSFADKKEFHDQALAGARKLDHRTADAVEMVNGDEFAGRQVLGNLSALDLEATPALCASAQAALHRYLVRIHDPKADDARPYSELLERMGRSYQFSEYIWLASHGCDADAALSEVEDLIRAYQNSPARAAMLAKLASLHRNK